MFYVLIIRLHQWGVDDLQTKIIQAADHEEAIRICAESIWLGEEPSIRHAHVQKYGDDIDVISISESDSPIRSVWGAQD